MSLGGDRVRRRGSSHPVPYVPGRAATRGNVFVGQAVWRWWRVGPRVQVETALPLAQTDYVSIAGAYDCAVSLGAEPLPANRRVSSTRYPRSETSIPALIIGGDIGGLAAVVALQRVGIEAVAFERSPRLAEVGAGLSLWANAMIALRRLGLESAALDVGSVIQSTRTFSPQGQGVR
jgi:hypothetical protein